MSKKTILQQMRMILYIFIWLMSVPILHAQSNGVVLKWDKVVGCIDYSNEDKEREKAIDLLEVIEEGDCVRVCENTTIGYTLEGTNILNVQWQVTGGTVSSNSGLLNSITWGAHGNGSITLTITSTTGIVTTYTICVEKIISPIAKFYVLGDNSFCLNSPIQFVNESYENGGTSIVHYQWDFGDGNFSSLFEPTHSYDTPGVYTVLLKVTNSCNCTSEYKYEIEIIEKPYVSISCASVVCEGDLATYTANEGEECEPGSGHWEVKGGTIINQNGNTIEVLWDQVDPNDGFGYVSYLSNCSCPFWTTVKIPVVLKKANIIGSPVICLNKQSKFSLPQWPTTDFQWTLSPSGSSNNLVLTDQRNEIIVDALEPGYYVLQCSYYNTLLGCEGRSEIKLQILEGVEINENFLPFCAGTSKTFTNNSGSIVYWEIYHNNVLVADATSSNITYNFPSGGTYTVTATKDGCKSEPVLVQVTGIPSRPTGPIQGVSTYCIHTPYTFSIPANTEPNTVYVWEIVPSTAGAFQGSNVGNEVTVIFTASSATITVKRQSTDGLGCQSKVLKKEVEQISVNGTITNVNGQTSFCPSSETIFNLNLNITDYESISWSIVGTGTGGPTQNFGNVISGMNSTSATINFNEISSGITNGIVYAHVTKCGITHNIAYPVTIKIPPVLQIVSPTTVCSDENFTLSYTSTPSINSMSSIKWIVNGNVYTTSTVTTSISNTSASNMSYPIILEITDPNGCIYVIRANKDIIINPRPDVSVQGYNYSVCPTDNYSIPLNSNVGSGLNSNLIYEWYKVGNSTPIGYGTSYTIDNASQGTTPGGSYYLKVTHTLTGCFTKTPNINVGENCIPGNPCSVNETVDITSVEWTSCNQLSIQVYRTTTTGTPTIEWIVPSQFTQLAPFNSTTGNFEVTTPGVYDIYVKVNYPSCSIIKKVDIVKKYQPKFNYQITCQNGIYTVSLLNNSVFAPGYSATYQYNSTGGTLVQHGLNNQNATITNLSPGTYTFSLTLNGTTGDVPCIYTQTIELPNMPNLSYSIPNMVYCSDASIPLTITSPTPGIIYSWHFAGTSITASNNTTYIQHPNGGSLQITLKAKNIYGCEVTGNTTTVMVDKPLFIGTLSETNITVCEGSIFTPITFNTTTGTVPTGYHWMQDNAIAQTGNSFVPTQSGTYWLQLVSANNCIDNSYSNQPIHVTFKKLPFVNITGTSDVCYNNTTTLVGYVNDPTLEYLWSVNNVAIGSWTTATSNTLNITVPGNVPGTYVYRLEVRESGGTGCSNYKDFVVIVHPPLQSISVGYTISNCQPYTIQLTANGPAGTYNWSDGQTGQTIEVVNGGAYSVTYTAPSGCTTSIQIQTPHNPERYLWVVPTGCYDICPNTDRYLLGPLGIQEYYSWNLNQTSINSGNYNAVPPQLIQAIGEYQLMITNGICDVYSPIAHIMINDKECEIQPCDFKYGIEDIVYNFDGLYYEVYGYVQNTSATTLVINFSSLNNYGSFTPGSVTLAPGQVYNFSPLQFVPNGNMPLSNLADAIVISTDYCADVIDIKWPPSYQYKKASSTADVTTTVRMDAQIVLTPNPAKDFTIVKYDLGTTFETAQNLTVYSLTGAKMYSQKIHQKADEITLDITSFAPGTYIISIEADYKKVLQEKLIKK